MCHAPEKSQFLVKKSFTMKRRLPGRFARINLNKFWSELEELYAGRTSSRLLVLPELQDQVDAEEQNRINELKEMS